MEATSEDCPYVQVWDGRGARCKSLPSLVWPLTVLSPEASTYLQDLTLFVLRWWRLSNGQDYAKLPLFHNKLVASADATLDAANIPIYFGATTCQQSSALQL